MKLSSATDAYMRELNKKPKLFNKTPKHIFQPSVNWPIFHKTVKRPFVTFVCRPGLTGIDFRVDTSIPLALGFLHFIYSSNLQVGYLFEVDPTAKIHYNDNYILAYRSNINWNDAKNIEAEVPLTNQFITMYSHGEELILAIKKQFVYPVFKP